MMSGLFLKESFSTTYSLNGDTLIIDGETYIRVK